MAAAGATIGDRPGVAREPGVLLGGPPQEHHLLGLDVPDRDHVVDVPRGVDEQASRALVTHRQHIVIVRQLRSTGMRSGHVPQTHQSIHSPGDNYAILPHDTAEQCEKQFQVHTPKRRVPLKEAIFSPCENAPFQVDARACRACRTLVSAGQASDGNGM